MQCVKFFTCPIDCWSDILKMLNPKFQGSGDLRLCFTKLTKIDPTKSRTAGKHVKITFCWPHKGVTAKERLHCYLIVARTREIWSSWWNSDIFLHKYSVIMSRRNMTLWRHLIREPCYQEFGCFINCRSPRVHSQLTRRLAARTRDRTPPRAAVPCGASSAVRTSRAGTGAPTRDTPKHTRTKLRSVSC